jgi:hypothetical protein
MRSKRVTRYLPPQARVSKAKTTETAQRKRKRDFWGKHDSVGVLLLPCVRQRTDDKGGTEERAQVNAD